MRFTTLSLLAAVALIGCREKDPIDTDLDGVPVEEDCNDLDPAMFPGNTEICDGIDNDCNGEIDDSASDALTFFADADQDGFGDAATSQASCVEPVGYVSNDTDCDDASAAFHPGAAEADCTDPADYNCDGSVGYADADADGHPACEECDDSLPNVNPDAVESCDEIDNNCNGVVDEQVPDAPIWYLDADGDGYGNASVSQATCEAPEGFVADATDCDDLEPTVFPGAEELCDGLPNACGDLPADEADEDGDGFRVCAGDCDDAHAESHPGATEVCDELDNDCDANVDEDAVDRFTVYADADHDGFGYVNTATKVCEVPDGYVFNSTDCDDTAGTAYPGANELCADTLDNDCDGEVNEATATDAAVWHLDADGDAHGRNDAGTRACVAPNGYVSSSDDCDDLQKTVYPGATEVCDGLPNACGTLPADESDADNDGFRACSGDCNDSASSIKPGANEICDDVDQDCDGQVDEGAIDPTVWHADQDRDAYGHPYVTQVGCDAPSGFVRDGTDCDDARALVNPSARELPGNELDDDCDGSNPDLLVYVTSRFEGKVYAVNYWTGDTEWTVSGLGELLDIVVGADGTLYAVDLNEGIVAIAADGSDTWPVLEGVGQSAGLWYASETDTLLLTTFDGKVLEVDPADGSYVTLVDAGPSVIKDVVRFTYSDSLTLSMGSDIQYYLPSLDIWVKDETLASAPWGLVPANDGGYFVGTGSAGTLYHTHPHTSTTAYALGQSDYGLCPDPTANGGVLIADHLTELLGWTPADGIWDTLNNGFLDEPFSCATNGLRDFDDDGQEAVAYGGMDCDDADPDVFFGADDKFGDGLDTNCDNLDGHDADADGVAVDNTNADCADLDDDDSLVGFGPACIQTSCKATLAARPGVPSGVYKIDPDGDTDLTDAFDVYCDMTTRGGGWTLVAKMSNADATSNWHSYSTNWITSGAFGASTDPAANADARSRAWGEMNGDEVMVTRNGTADLVSATACLNTHSAMWAFQRHSQNDADCAMSCGTVVRQGYWAQGQTDSTLKFRCMDMNGGTTNVGGYNVSGDDNSFLTTLTNNPYMDYNFGLGAGYMSAPYSVDWDYSVDDYGNPTDAALMGFWVR